MLHCFLVAHVLIAVDIVLLRREYEGFSGNIYLSSNTHTHYSGYFTPSWRKLSLSCDQIINKHKKLEFSMVGLISQRERINIHFVVVENFWSLSIHYYKVVCFENFLFGTSGVYFRRSTLQTRVQNFMKHNVRFFKYLFMPLCDDKVYNLGRRFRVIVDFLATFRTNLCRS